MTDTEFPIDYQKVSYQLQRDQRKPYQSLTFRFKAFYPRIKEALEQLTDHNYDFLYSSSPDIWNKLIKDNKRAKTPIPIRTFRRTCYLRMECQRCSEKKGNIMRKRRWATELGTFEIQYALLPFKDLIRIDKPKLRVIKPERDEWLLLFRCRAYRMKCEKCNSWGEVLINETVLKAIQQLFSQEVCDVLDDQQPTFIYEGPLTNLKSHKSHLCEACDEGVCMKVTEKDKEGED